MNPYPVLDAVKETIARPAFWLIFGFNDVRSRYRRSRVGQLWITLSVGVFVAAVAFFYAAIFGVALAEYMPYFATGYILWFFIMTMVSEAAVLYSGSAAILQQGHIPLTALPLQLATRNLVVLMHNALVLLVVYILFPWDLASAHLSLLGLVITTATLIFLSVPLGFLAARFRDVQQLIVAVTPLLFLVTPILWQLSSNQSSVIKIMVEWNPFYYWLEIIRGPLLNEQLPNNAWSISLGLLVLAGLLAGGCLRWTGTRLTYWL